MATATKTKTITETHLLVATAILLSAAGLAFLIAPISPTSSLFADSDGGYNLAVKGTTKGYDAATGKTVQRTDACVSAKPTAITEYSCKGSNVLCASASCSTGQVCSDGACVTPVATPKSCTDTDGGWNFQQTGNTTVSFSDGSTSQSADTCLSSRFVREYACGENNTATSTDYYCPLLGAQYECQNGACVVATLPDLSSQITILNAEGESLWPGTTLVEGDQIQIVFGVTNFGSAPAAANTILLEIKDQNGVLLTSATEPVPALTPVGQPGDRIVLTISRTIFSGWAGKTIGFYFTVDSDNVVAENNEENNKGGATGYPVVQTTTTTSTP